MKKPIDIVDIKQAIKDGTLAFYVKDNTAYLRNDIGECVSLGMVEPKWIPVETALPEGLMVNTLVSCEDDNGLPVRTMVALYDAFSKTWDCEYKVIAWMPLPTPYEPQERNDEE